MTRRSVVRCQLKVCWKLRTLAHPTEAIWWVLKWRGCHKIRNFLKNPFRKFWTIWWPGDFKRDEMNHKWSGFEVWLAVECARWGTFQIVWLEARQQKILVFCNCKTWSRWAGSQGLKFLCVRENQLSYEYRYKGVSNLLVFGSGRTFFRFLVHPTLHDEIGSKNRISKFDPSLDFPCKTLAEQCQSIS